MVPGAPSCAPTPPLLVVVLDTSAVTAMPVVGCIMAGSCALRYPIKAVLAVYNRSRRREGGEGVE